MALVLFVSAGTLSWWRASVLVVVLLVARTISAVIAHRVNPALLLERAGLPLHRDQPWADRLLVLGVLGAGFLGVTAVAGLDRFHWHVFARPGVPLGGAGLVLFALGWGIKGWALRANTFATAVVRLQHERNHAVVMEGPYGVVRHPFYAADPLIFLGLSLWLESYVAMVFAIAPIALMMVRLTLEERFLRKTLPNYAEYTRRVRYRLVPGLW